MKIKPQNLPLEGIEGVEKKQLFSRQELDNLFEGIKDWFNQIKNHFPKGGFVIYSRHDDPELFLKSKIKLPVQVTTLLNAIISDAIRNPNNSSRPIAKILFERTGIKNSDPDDFGYHMDTKQVYFDDNGNRTGYDPQRGPDKYMIFIDRPGSYVIRGKVDQNLNHSEAIKQIASQYSVDIGTGETVVKEGAPIPSVFQLPTNEVYKVEVGNILHAPPPHEDGLLITLSLIEEMPKSKILS